MTSRDPGLPGRQAIIESLQDRIDDYVATVEAVMALAHVTRWDDASASHLRGSNFGIGCGMRTSSSNPVSPEVTVTPDLVVQLSPHYGLIAEAKAGFPRDRARWIDDVLQVKKYDDTLTGWHGTCPATHDLALLVRNDRKVAVTDYIRELDANGTVRFQRRFAVIAFHRVEKRQVLISLERHSGSLSHAAIDEMLRVVKEVPIRYLAPYGAHFHDCAPPLPYLMSVIWNEVFPSVEAVTDYLANRRVKQALTLEITTTEVRNKLRQKFNPPGLAKNSRVPPKKAWVAEAMAAFVRYGYARALGREKFEVTFKRLGEPLKIFIGKVADEELRATKAASKAAAQPPQPQLPLLFE